MWVIAKYTLKGFGPFGVEKIKEALSFCFKQLPPFSRQVPEKDHLTEGLTSKRRTLSLKVGNFGIKSIIKHNLQRARLYSPSQGGVGQVNLYKCYLKETIVCSVLEKRDFKIETAVVR